MSISQKDYIKMVTRLLALALMLCWIPFHVGATETGPNIQIPKGGCLRGHFLETHNFSNASKGEKALISSGEFMISPGAGVIWQVQKPLPLTIAATSSGIAQSIGGIQLKYIPASKMPVAAQASELISAALTGKWEALNQMFKITTMNQVSNWQVIIVPLKPDKSIPFKSIMAVGKKYVEQVDLLRLDDGTDHLTFSSQRIDTSPLTTSELLAFAKTRQ